MLSLRLHAVIPHCMHRRAFTKLLGGFAVAGTVGTGPVVAAERSFTTHQRVEITSWDGTTIVGTLYVPDGPSPRPAVLLTHGYGNTRADAADTAKRYARNGYVVLAYDSRGFGDSGGESGFDGPKEVGDALVLVDQFAEGTFTLPDGDVVTVNIRPTENGPAVGMDGGSYAGGIQLNTAGATAEWFRDADAVQLPDLEETLEHVSLEPSPLDAIVPRITWHDLRQAAAPNGVIKQTWDAFILAVGAEGYERNNRPDAEGPDPRLYEFTVEAVATNELPDEAEAYFAKRSPDPAAIAANGVPTLQIQGWPDNLLPPNQALANVHGIQDAGGTAAIVFFPGGHDVEFPVESRPEGSVQPYLDAISLAWMDRHVEGDTSRWATNAFPTVSVYQQQFPDVPADHRTAPWPAWRAADEWPPTDVTASSLDLAAASATEQTVLANSIAPTSARGPTGSLFGSPNADAPVTSKRFDFVADGFVDVVGTPHLSLTVTPLGDDAFVFAKLALVEAGDRTGTVIDEQVMPVRVRDDPGRRTTVEFDLVAFQRYLDAGDRLRLILAATDNGYASSRGAGAIVHHAEGESTLTIDTISESS